MVCAVVVLLCCGGLITGGVLFVQSGFSAARKAATMHADALVAGDYAGAYEELCDRYRSSITKDDYVRLTSEYYRKVRSYEVVDVDLPLRGKASATIKLTDQAGVQTSHVWPLAVDIGQGEVKVCFDRSDRAPQY